MDGDEEEEQGPRLLIVANGDGKQHTGSGGGVDGIHRRFMP